MSLVSLSLFLQLCQNVLFIRLGWFLRWEAGGRIVPALWDVDSVFAQYSSQYPSAIAVKPFLDTLTQRSCGASI